MKILGLDISTSITGATVMEGDKIIESVYWDTRNKNKYDNIYAKAHQIRVNLLLLWTKHNIEEVFIEQSLHSFRSGFSSAQTLSTLSKFNGMVSWFCYEIFNKKPNMISASSARKTAGITVKRGQNAKQKVLDFIIDKYPKVVIQYTKHGNPKPGMLDMCDSIIIARAGSKIVREVRNT